ncbi:MAG: S8 family serine peptidase [Bacteroidia bacterium]|nr:S8 family serine peptidase [Bacteroidia bacterium]
MKTKLNATTSNRHRRKFSRNLIAGGISLVAIALAVTLFFALDLGSVDQSFASGNLGKLFTEQYNPKDVVPGRVILKIKDSHRNSCTNGQISIPELNQKMADWNGVTTGKLFPNAQKPRESHNALRQPFVDLSLIYEFRFDTTFTVEQVVRELNQLGFIEYAEPRFIYQSFYAPNDPKLGDQYYLTAINALLGWDLSKGDSNIVIGIIDTGTSFGHSELKDKVWFNLADTIDGIDNDQDGYVDNYRGWDFGGSSLTSPPDNDPSWAGTMSGVDHGVLVSGVSVAQPNNGIGIAGVGYNCKYLPLKASYDNNTGVAYGFDALVYAADHGVPIINLSWGYNGFSQYGQDVVNYAAINKGCLVVAAAGNTPSEIEIYPASYDNILSVGGTQAAWINNVQEHDFVWYSNSGFGTSYNYLVDVVAPARNIRTTSLTNSYYAGATGTSLASPIVAGAAGILKAHFPNYTNYQIGQLLRITSHEIYTKNPDPAYTDKLGHGRIDLFDALNSSKPSVRVDSLYFKDHNNNRPEPYDTVEVYAKFINYLDPVSNLQVTLSTPDSTCVEILNSTVTVGAIPTLGYQINAQPFRIVIRENCDIEIEKWLKFSLSDPSVSYEDFEYRKFSIFPICIPFEVNNLHLSVTPIGNIGFGDCPSNNLGLGWDYKSMGNNLKTGGFMMGSSLSNFTDATKNQVSSPTRDYNLLAPPVIHEPGKIAAKEAFCQFSDGLATLPLGLKVDQNTFAFSEPGMDDFIIMEYVIRNPTNTYHSHLSAGILLEWGGTGTALTALSSGFNAGNNLLFAELGTNGGGSQIFSGIRLLTNQNAVSFNKSANAFYFTDVDKFNAISQGSSSITNVTGDLVQSLAVNQINLNPGDSIIIAFALISGMDQQDLNDHAAMALEAYHCRVRTRLLPLNLGADITECLKNAPVNLSAPVDQYETYIWSTGSTTPQITVDNAGTYYLDVFNSDGCHTSDTIHVNLLTGTSLIFANKSEADINESITFSSNAPLETNYVHWDFGDGTGASNQFHPNYSYQSPGTYLVTLISGNGYCFDTTTMSITIKALVTGTGQNLPQNDEISVFPNPASSYISTRIQNDYQGETILTVLDMQGRTVLRKTFSKFASRFEPQLEIAHIPAGNYALQVSMGDLTRVLRFIKR